MVLVIKPFGMPQKKKNEFKQKKRKENAGSSQTLFFGQYLT